ncbi:nuclear cap-binding protein subunit 1 isoform X2 [Nerophis ophidion]|uniref:nuclear cap-binding protein subunit 1 isoform X2 n=1 Tax=Nerophis ophidion TaxID=159077 RepID=UPI002ADF0B3D|nr:nuclear cap-binding protein subunit 1 isoform X2 [Nerophis ophidion]
MTWPGFELTTYRSQVNWIWSSSVEKQVNTATPEPKHSSSRYARFLSSWAGQGQRAASQDVSYQFEAMSEGFRGGMFCAGRWRRRGGGGTAPHAHGDEETADAGNNGIDQHLKDDRLSYHQRIVDIVPPTFSALIPANPIFIYKYTEENASSLLGYPISITVGNAIKNRASNEEILTVLKDVPNPNQDDDDDEGESFNPLRVEVFLQTLLHLAAKSFSHSFSALGKFHEILKNLAESDEGKLHILKVVHEVWKNHPQMTAVLVDKMIRTQIVDCAAVANWLFSQDMAHEFTRLYIWEILHSTIRKMNKHVQKIQKELEEAKDKLEKQQHKRRDSGDDEDMEKNSEDEEGQLEEQIERLQEKVESAQSEQKNLFLVIFQRFIMLLTEHLVRCETGSVNVSTPWYKNCVERLQQIFLMHHGTIQQYMGTLENLLFTAELDHHILAVYQQFCALQL